jgi:CBS domain-containing protein
MLVRECLHSAPVTVSPQCTVAEAAELMRTKGVGSLLIVFGGKLAGILTDRDIVVRCVGVGSSADEPVEAFMTPDPVVIQGSSDIFVAFKTLRDIEARRLPVLEDEELAGIVTVDDLLVALVMEFGAVASPVAKEITHPQI